MTTALLRNLTYEEADRIAVALIKRARKNHRDLETLLDRTDGKVTDKLSITGTQVHEIIVAEPGAVRPPGVED